MTADYNGWADAPEDEREAMDQVKWYPMTITEVLAALGNKRGTDVRIDPLPHTEVRHAR